MQKRASHEIKEEILRCAKEKHYTYAQLERKINTGFRTIKSNCHELEMYGLVRIEMIKEHPSNKKPSYSVFITGAGIEVLRIKKKI